MSRQNNGRGSDSLLESLESMQKAINHVRAQLDSLPRRFKAHKRRTGLGGFVREHPVITACAAVSVLVLLTGVVMLVMRRKR